MLSEQLLHIGEAQTTARFSWRRADTSQIRRQDALRLRSGQAGVTNILCGRSKLTGSVSPRSFAGRRPVWRHTKSTTSNASRQAQPMWSAAARRRCFWAKLASRNPRRRFRRRAFPFLKIQEAPLRGSRLQHVPASRDGRQRRQAAALHMARRYATARGDGWIVLWRGATSERLQTTRRERLILSEWLTPAKHVCRIRRGGPCPCETVSRGRRRQ